MAVMRAAARGSWRTRASATLPIVALALACESGTSATDEGETDGHETGEVDTDAAGPEDAPAGFEDASEHPLGVTESLRALGHDRRGEVVGDRQHVALEPLEGLVAAQLGVALEIDDRARLARADDLEQQERHPRVPVLRALPRERAPAQRDVRHAHVAGVLLPWRREHADHVVGLQDEARPRDHERQLGRRLHHLEVVAVGVDDLGELEGVGALLEVGLEARPHPHLAELRRLDVLEGVPAHRSFTSRRIDVAPWADSGASSMKSQRA